MKGLKKILALALAALLMLGALASCGTKPPADDGKITVSFDLAYKGAPASAKPEDIRVKTGEPYGALPVPLRDGFTLEGWYSSSTAFVSRNRVTAETTVTEKEDHTLYANWTGNQVTVQFDLNGGTYMGSDTVPDAKVSLGDPYGIAIPKESGLEREGYAFMYWYNPLASYPLVSPVTTVTTNETHTLYAEWQELKTLITFGEIDDMDHVGVTSATYDLVDRIPSNLNQGDPSLKRPMLKVTLHGGNSDANRVAILNINALNVKAGDEISFIVDFVKADYAAYVTETRVVSAGPPVEQYEGIFVHAHGGTNLNTEHKALNAQICGNNTWNGPVKKVFTMPEIYENADSIYIVLFYEGVAVGNYHKLPFYIYDIKVSAPFAFDPNKTLWDFTEPNDIRYFSNITSEPAIGNGIQYIDAARAGGPWLKMDTQIHNDGFIFLQPLKAGDKLKFTIDFDFPAGMKIGLLFTCNRRWNGSLDYRWWGDSEYWIINADGANDIPTNPANFLTWTGPQTYVVNVPVNAPEGWQICFRVSPQFTPYAAFLKDVEIIRLDQTKTEFTFDSADDAYYFTDKLQAFSPTTITANTALQRLEIVYTGLDPNAWIGIGFDRALPAGTVISFSASSTADGWIWGAWSDDWNNRNATGGINTAISAAPQTYTITIPSGGATGFMIAVQQGAARTLYIHSLTITLPA